MGHVVYTGPPAGAVPWFKTLGYEYVLVRDGSASDWLIDLVSVGFDKPEVSSDWFIDPVSVGLDKPEVSSWGPAGAASHSRVPVLEWAHLPA